MRIWPVGKSIALGDTIKLKTSDARHIKTVLRKNAGDIIKVSGQNGRVFEAKITESSKTILLVEVKKEVKAQKLKKPYISLAVSICKQQAMELVVQKAVELGCAAFYPVITERSVGDKISKQKLTRMEKIVHEACKQCGRPREMKIARPAGVESLPEADLKIALWEEEKENTLRSVLEKSGDPGNIGSVLLLVGPPGGFTQSEARRLEKLGYETAGAGDLILKSETAAIALLSIAGYHFGILE
ncbi:MAG: RsmE family RNA methyltransferase [Nitrospinota bacterium]